MAAQPASCCRDLIWIGHCAGRSESRFHSLLLRRAPWRGPTLPLLLFRGRRAAIVWNGGGVLVEFEADRPLTALGDTVTPRVECDLHAEAKLQT